MFEQRIALKKNQHWQQMIEKQILTLHHKNSNAKKP